MDRVLRYFKMLSGILYSMKQIKIAFVGTSCIGKTWLFEEFRRELDGGASFVEEAARLFFSTHPNVHNRFSFAAQTSIQQLALKTEKHALSGLIFCDRSVLDAAAYIYALGNRDGADFLVKRVRDWLPTYSKIYLLDPTDIPYATDGIRDESEHTRWKFHKGFVELFSKYTVPYQLLSGTKDERIEIVRKFIHYV